MNDRKRNPPNWPSELDALDRPQSERIPRADRTQVMWSWVAIVAMVFVLGVTFYAIDTRLDERHARQAPATVPSLASDFSRPTTNPAATDQTTGQGRSGNDAAGEPVR